MSLLHIQNGETPQSKPLISRKLVVLSGGSAANNLVDVFNEVIDNHVCSLTYVIPISDNGGSSSELIRVFGGPGIGDVRSKRPLISLLLHVIDAFRRLVLLPLQLRITTVLRVNGTLHISSSVGILARSYRN